LFAPFFYMDQFLKNNLNLIPQYKQKKFLLAVSGGVDSMVLLHLFKKHDLSFEVAHCNFQLRGIDSDNDELFVKEVCEINNIKFHIKHFDTKRIESSSKDSIQMIARKLRYNWFKHLCKEYTIDYIVTAHHLNDQIETFFLNLCRGTGINGLKGIEVLKDRLFRPLINVSKENILSYSKLNSISFREDESNLSTKYKRNLIRHKIIPLFEELNASFSSSMENTLAHIKDSNSFLEQSIKERLKPLIREENEQILIDLNALKKFNHLSLHLFYALTPFGYNRSQITLIVDGIHNNSVGKWFYSKSHQLLIDRSIIIITKNIKNVKNDTVVIKKTDTSVTYPVHLTFEDIDSFNKSLTKQHIALLDKSKLTFPLTLRNWKHGDSFAPLGMGKKRKKVSDYLTDEKIDSFTKRKVFVLESGNEICWIVGYRLSELFKVTSSTNKILKITLTDLPYGNN